MTGWGIFDDAVLGNPQAANLEPETWTETENFWKVCDEDNPSPNEIIEPRFYIGKPPTNLGPEPPSNAYDELNSFWDETPFTCPG